MPKSSTAYLLTMYFILCSVAAPTSIVGIVAGVIVAIIVVVVVLVVVILVLVFM